MSYWNAIEIEQFRGMNVGEMTLWVNGVQTQSLTALPGVNAGMREGSSFSWFLTDHLGSVVGVTDADATLISQTRYTLW